MQIKRNGSVLSYRKSGTGPEALLMFHGFGQDHRVFNPLIVNIADRYTCYAFDLFFHGQSTWPDANDPLTREKWASMLSEFLHLENISRFSVLGFSIGARPAIALAGSHAAQINEIVLIAPDGIGRNIWFSLATGTKAGQLIFRWLTRNRGFLTALGSIVKKLGFIDRHLMNFAARQLASPARADKVFHTWMVYRKLVFDDRELGRRLNAERIHLILITGKQDRVIEPGRLNKLISHPPLYFSHHALDVPHHHLLREVSRKAHLLTVRSGNQR